MFEKSSGEVAQIFARKTVLLMERAYGVVFFLCFISFFFLIFFVSNVFAHLGDVHFEGTRQYSD